MEDIGEVREIKYAKEIEWRIHDFISLVKDEEEMYSYCSPEFSFMGDLWNLEIWSNGDGEENSLGHIGLYLYRNWTDTSISVTFSFALKTINGKKVHEQQRTHDFEEHVYSGFPDFLERSTLLEENSRLLPSGTLTILCLLQHARLPNDADGDSLAECFYCETKLDAESFSTYERKCKDKPIKCPKCSDMVLLQNWHEHECQPGGKQEEESLIQDYKKVLLHGKDHDFILKVGDKELRAHKDILRARSHVFESMLNHDMKEKNSGFIDVPDCDPQAMEQFLSYVYCGKVEALDENIMCGLYYIADKYDMKSLKGECCDFIKKSLSFINICDIIKLALNHSDNGLLEYAKEYFMENALDIFRTVEWQCFLKDNLTVGNELLIKSFEKLKMQ